MIITIIVLEIPLPDNVTLNSILNLKMYFFSYFVSFLLCYNFWNNHQKFYEYIENINHQVIWLTGAILFVLSFIPFPDKYNH
ncbi:TMEM175 family protein [Methanosphaera sp. ISO3-F5]|uniref:TMEM175 family protein n=1 Tax=Methanosphaera sp. ISO3-F5 TaxID=1452353 RepID=UPI00396485B8